MADMRPASFTPEELLRYCRPSGVDRVVLIQMSFYGTDNSYMLDCIAARPETFRGVAVVDPARPDLEAEMGRLRDAGIRGFRIMPGRSGPGEFLIGPDDLRLCALAGDLRMAICPLIDPEYIPAVGRAARDFPATTFVIDHLARVGLKGATDPPDVEALCRLAESPGCNVKVSAFYALGEKRPPHTDLAPLIEAVHAAFGADRLLWATDCPYQVVDEKYDDSLSLVRDRLPFLTDREREAVLRTTAERIFFSE
jgi:predicted TIM-barrel fold metal-dependent hydrolase